MRSLAEVLVDLGWQLSGSDRDVQSAGFLAARGVRLYQGHAADQVRPATDLVVHTSAVDGDHAELRQAGRLNIPTLTYFQALGRLMAGRRGLAVAGTHGKSSTTALAAALLESAGLDPTVVYGAAPLGRHGGGRAGGGEIMLAEACEFRANFLELHPRQLVVTGIEADHFDCFPRPEQLDHAFSLLIGNVPKDGLVLAAGGCRRTRRALRSARARVETFGLDAGADWSAGRIAGRGGLYRFTIRRRGRAFCHVRLRVPGRHNVLNALAAAALAHANGVAAEQIAAGLGQFAGLRRRMETVARPRGVTVLDDYAHHPTSLAAALTTARQICPGGRLWCVFEPHQVSRTARLLDELAESLQNADEVVITDIFPAREPPAGRGAVTSEDLVRRVRLRGLAARALSGPEEIASWLAHGLVPGDVLVTAGAGRIGKVCDAIVDRLREDRAAG